ncbi:PAS domain-containing protein [Mucilaginibacter sp. AW1-3]
MNNAKPLLSDLQLLDILSLSNYAVAVHVTEDAVIQFANDAMLAIWGKGGSVIGKSLEEALPELKGQPFIDLFKRVWNEGITVSGTDTPADLKINGELKTFYFDYEYRAIKNAQGQTYAILHTAFDVTERYLGKEREQNLTEELRASNEELSAANEELNAANEELTQSQEALRKIYDELADSNARFRSMVSQAPVGICIIRASDLMVTDANDSYLELAGKKREDLENHTIWDAVPEAAEAYAPIMNEVISSGEAFIAREHEVMLIRNGVPENVFLDFVYEPMWQNEVVSAIMVLAIDVTDKVNARIEVQRAEELHRFSIDAANGATWHMDAETHEFTVSPRLREIFDLPPDGPVTYDNILSKIPADYHDSINQGIQASVAQNQSYTMEHPIVYADGSRRWVRASGKLYAAEGPRRAHFSGLILDITAQVESREAILNLNNELAAANEELLSTNEELNATIDELRVTRDELKQSQLEVEQSEEALRFALHAANLGTFDLDPATNRFKGNAMLKSWFGLGPDDEIEFSKAINIIAERDRNNVLSAIQDALNFRYGGHYDIEYTIINPLDPRPRYVRAKGQTLFNARQQPVRFSGTVQDITEERRALMELERSYEQERLSKEAAQLGTFDMDLLANTLEWDERCRTLFGISHKDPVSYDKDFLPGLHPDDRERVTDVIKDVFVKSVNNGNYDVEYRTIGADDQKIRWVRAKGKALFNEHDEPVRFIGSVLDITDQKQDDIRKSAFISMVSHELKTPLTSLKAYVQLLGAKARKDSDHFAAGALGKVEVQVNKMHNMIDGFLNLSRLEAGKIQLNKTSFDLSDVVKDIMDETLLLGATHAIKLLPCESISVFADKDKIGHVISNFISNAIKYSPRGSNIDVNCEKTGNNIKVSVKDEGVGIKSQDLSKLFDRFYRVENANTQHVSGFGIGLYLSAEIIERHHGKIGVESEPGSGSTFWFTIPVNK